MNKKNYILVLLVLVQLLMSCEKIIPNLERDNPYDASYSGDPEKIIKKLEYYSHKVACKQIGTSPFISYSTDNNIHAGEKIWLDIRLKNSSNFNISGIKGSVSSSSNLITISPVPSSYYLKFGDASNNSNIEIGKIGWGEIKSENNFHFAPNYNSYSVEFTVSNSANVGSNIPFTLNLIDEEGTKWILDFYITII
jgi:hypothetical protein